jgi:hypothetical protein
MSESTSLNQMQNKATQSAEAEKLQVIHKTDNSKEQGFHLTDNEDKVFEISQGLNLLGRVVDADGSKPGYLLSFKTLIGKENTVDIPLVDQGSPEKITSLLVANGFTVHSVRPKQIGQFLVHYLEQNCQVDVTFVRAKSDGWLQLPDGKRTYVFGNDLMGADSARFKAVRLNNKANVNAQLGSKEAWFATLVPLANEPIAVLTICAALSAPLLEPLNYPALMLFFYGPSSIGKTVLSRLLASVFGSPNDVLTWEGTDNGIEAAVLASKDKPLVLDEIGQAKARQFSALSYRLTNDGSKLRANSKGEMVEAQRPRTVILSAGEIDPASLMLESKLQPRGGQLARLVSISAEMTHGIWNDLGEHKSGAEKSRWLSEQLQTVYGIAGKQFCKKIVLHIDKHTADFRMQAKALTEEIYPGELPTDDGVPGRVLENFVLFAFTGLLAIEVNIVPWSRHNVVDAMQTGYARWLKQYMARKPAQDQALLAPLRVFFQSQRGSKFKPLNSWRENHEGTVAGFEHVIKGEPLFLVYPAYFEQQLCADYARRDVLGALRKSGLLQLSPRGGPVLQVHLPGSEKKNRGFYGIRQSILHN